MTFIDTKQIEKVGIQALKLYNEKWKFKNETIPQIEKEHNVKVLMAYVRGSHMYGTNISTSDVDVLFVYQQKTNCILRGDYMPQINYGGNDIVGYEIERFIQLLTQNNPNILEALDIPPDCMIHFDFMMRNFDQKDWLTKKTRDSILGYANSQIKKATGLNKNMNHPQPVKRKTILDFCYVIDGAKSIHLPKWVEKNNADLSRAGLVDVPVGKGMHAMYLDIEGKYTMRGLIKNDDSVNLRVSSIPKELADIQTPVSIYYNLDGFQRHCSDWAKYWKWEKERNEDRFKMNQEAGQGVDLKNMMHLFRLLEMCENISIGKGIKVRSENVQQLLDIREGKYNYKDLLETSDLRFELIKKNFETVDLPEDIDPEKAKDLLLNFRLTDIN